MKSTIRAARAIAWRHLYKWITVPANFLPTFLFPLVFFMGFAGALGQIGNVAGFHYAGNYTSWIFVFALLQTCLLGGVAAGFTIAGDFQSGFAQRLMLAIADRRAILLGYVLSMFRARSPQLGPALQVPIFVVVFFAPVYVPLDLLDGWLHAVATINPITYVLAAGRGLLVGGTNHLGIAVLCIAGMLAVLLAWALRGVRAAERASG